MEAAIRFSQNSRAGSYDQRFLRVDVTSKSFQLCQITESSDKKVKYDVIHSSAKVPAFRAFDWHPVDETLVAVGQSGGEATLLNIADGHHDSISFSVRSQRLCNAIALSPQNMIAVGLDKVRTDFCLNIWDLNQRLPSGNSKTFSKVNAEPVHKLAGGEPITSLKFFNQEPQLLIAGVKGQFVRLYDLRDTNSSNGLQFPTRCVQNLAIDNLDENYFASCLPANDPLICLWDRRMISRNSTSPVAFNGSSRPESRQPEMSLELKDVFDNSEMVWSLRFSKSRSGCLGVLSNTGHLKAYEFEKEHVPKFSKPHQPQQKQQPWHQMEPQNIFLRNVCDVERSPPPKASLKDQKQRIVSFDFTTDSTRSGGPKLMVLTGEGEIRMTKLRPPPEPASLSSTGFFCKGQTFHPAPSLDLINDALPRSVDRIRRAAEPRNALRQAFKQSKQNKSSSTGQHTDLRRMSSFANQCWNADLGFFEKGVPLDDLLKLISIPRLRCEIGYLLDLSKNKAAVADSQWLEAYWSWIERAERISRNNNMIQDNVDLSYLGVYGIWMEEIAIKPRLVGGCSMPKTAIIKNLVHRLNVPVRRLCSTEYRGHRQLCLYVSGLAWSHDELENTVKKLTNGNQHTKAAATALFASDEKLAYQALRSKTSSQTHKMLAMALAGSKQRRKSSATSSATEDSGTEGDDDWTETISSLSTDLTDPYARAILAYVKSGDWSDVLEIDALPLKHRLSVALRHIEDNELTAYIGRMTRQVIETGDIEGVILTGTGTSEGLNLFLSYAKIFNDLQTVTLGLSVGGAAERFVVGNDGRDTNARRAVEAFRETYRSQIMHWGRKFDRVRFDVASSKALGQSPQHKLQRPREQVRLVCTFCSGSLTQFPSNGTASNASTPSAGQGPANIRITDTTKHPLTAEKAAVTGTVCPKCGRHLPRCGVCDLWLGTPDETHAKWYLSQQQQANKAANGTNGTNGTNEKSKHTSMDLAASMSGSVTTTIGPMTASSTTVKPGSRENEENSDGEDGDSDIARRAEEKWVRAMGKFTVYCMTCGHGFHAEHARLWFEGRHGRDGHRVCPVPDCDCQCNG